MSKHRRGLRRAAVGAAAALLVGASLSAVSPVAAHAGLNDCYNSGAMTCLWSGGGYTGEIYLIANGGGRHGPCQLDSLGNRSDFASSLRNNTIDTQQMWVDVNFSGPSITIAPQTNRPFLSATFDKKLSSWKGVCYITL